ncbi:MAG TPA: lactate utilization protein C [Actinobacteria bacterium]|nr:lactate utilization protein C [Actinomycetota bacterium]
MRRDEFLGRLRRRLEAGFPPNLAHPLLPVDAIPTVDYREPLGDPVERFVEEVERVGGEANRVGTESALEELLAEIAASRVAVSRDPEVTTVLPLLDRLEVEVLETPPVEVLARIPVGITGAAGGIARTGTVVLDAGRAGGRTVSLVPETHVALVAEERIVPDPSAWWRRMTERHPEGPPSQLVFVTGPSKSADIELTLTVGVHGPRRLVVVVAPGSLLLGGR